MLHVVPHSSNRKLGPGVSASYRPVGLTCPPDCQLLASGVCYAERGNCASVASRSAVRDDDPRLLDGAPFVRWLVSGDWFRLDAAGRCRFDWKHFLKIVRWCKRNPQSQTWAYTHGWDRWPQTALDQCPQNLTVLASVDSPEDAAAAQAHGWRTARTTDDLSDRRAGEFICPVDAHKIRGERLPTTCIQCRACWERNDHILFKLF